MKPKSFLRRRKSSHEVILTTLPSPSPAKAINPIRPSQHEVLIDDQEKAKSNDKVIQAKINEARSLNRKNENGAEMHQFALWSRKASDQDQEHSFNAEEESDKFLADNVQSRFTSLRGPPLLENINKKNTSTSHEKFSLSRRSKEPFDNSTPLTTSSLPNGNNNSRSGGGFSQNLRQKVAKSNISLTSMDSVETYKSSSRITRANHSSSSDAGEEIEELLCRMNEVESVCSIEEEEEVRQMEFKSTPMRRRSYSDGELRGMIRHFSSEEIHNYTNALRSPSPTLSEVSRQSLEEQLFTDNQLLTTSPSSPLALRGGFGGHRALAGIEEVSSGIDFSDSTMRWRQGEFLGEGNFGRGYKGMKEETGELIAVKQLYLCGNSEEEVRILRKEISVMWDLHHPNIVR